MTEFAAVSGQTTVAPGVGAKGAGKAQGAGSVLDGAFAAIFGKAADGTAIGTDGKTAGMPGTDPALAVLDPALLEGEGAASTDGLDALGGKPRKPGSKNKTAPELAELSALPVQAALVTPAAEAPRATTDGKVETAPAIDAMAAPAAGQDAKAATKAADDASEALKALAADGKPVADMLAQAKGAPVAPAPARTDAQAALANASAAAQLAEQSAPDGSGAGAGEGRGGAQDRMAALAVATDAANDDSALAGGFDPLRDIMQSLPPVVQSQLNVGRTAGAAPIASTGQLLNDQVIDMGVSGQWIDRMAHEIAALADGTGHSRFQLSPPNLGRIQVDLWHGDDKMNLRLVAETDEAARRLRDGQSALESHARVASLSLGSVSVEKASPSESGRDANQRQGADANGNAQQQASAQAQGQSAQGRGNSNTGPNRGGASAVIGSERDGELQQAARTTRAADPRVRFA